MRMASTGLSRAAEEAGMMPESKPTTNEMPKPITTFFSDNTKLKSSVAALTAKVVSHTKISPNRPPIIAKSTASNKNWKRICCQHQYGHIPIRAGNRKNQQPYRRNDGI